MTDLHSPRGPLGFELVVPKAVLAVGREAGAGDLDGWGWLTAAAWEEQ
jgi:hypothetical protein